jgi:hypothetical protein
VSEPKNPETSEDQAERPVGKSSAGDPLGDMRDRISEVVDYFLYYISARIDSLKFAFKRRVFIASWIAIAVLAAAGAIITGVVLLCEGICDGLSVLFGHRWAGELTTGVLLLGVVAVGGFGAVGHLIRRSHLKSMAKYEAMSKKERERFGRDATGRADNGDRNG